LVISVFTFVPYFELHDFRDETLEKSTECFWQQKSGYINSQIEIYQRNNLWKFVPKLKIFVPRDA